MNKRGLSRILSVLLLVVMVVSMLPVSAYADGTATWTKVDLSAITAGDTVAITMSKDGTTWVLPNTAEGSSRQPLATATGTIAENKLTTDGSSGFAWNITATEGGYNISSGGSYLYVTASNNGVRIGSTQSVWSVSSDGYLTAKDSKDAARYLGVYSNQDWRCYTSTTTNIAGQTLGFWKLDSVGEPDPDPVETVATPTASVASGPVAEGTKVSFSCETKGAKISYKTGEGEYTEYTGPITLTAAATYTVKAVLNDINSEEAVFTYTIKDPYAVDAKYSVFKRVDKPEIGKTVLICSPSGSVALSSQPVEDKPYYFIGVSGTQDGYYFYVDVANTDTIEWTVGAGADGAYTFTQDEKMLSAYKDGDFVDLSADASNEKEWVLTECSPADSIYYVKNTAVKDKDSNDVYLQWFSNRFCAYGTSTPVESTYGMAFYELVKEGKETSTASPEASPAAGEVAKGTEVVLSCATKEASILYKTAADAEFAEYTAPIVIDEDTTITAKAVKEGLADSEEVSFVYTVKVNTKTADYTETIADGDKVVIYYPAGKKVLSDEVYVYTNKSGVSKDELVSLDGAVDGTTLTYSEGTAELNVVVDENGKYSFVTDEGKYLYLDGKDVNFADAAGDYTLFELETAENGYYIKSANALVSSNPQYMEYFSGYFTCFSLNTGKADYYTFQFFKIPQVENHIVTDLSELTDGAKVVIFNPANMKALSQTYSGYYNTGVDVTASDGKLSGYGSTEVWTVGVNSDGSYTFSTAEGKKLSMASSKSSMPLDDVNPNWNISSAATADCFYIKNTGRSLFVEWYKDKNYWSAYKSIGSNEDLFAQQFYLVVKEEEQPADTGLPEADEKVVIYNLNAEGVIGLEDELGATMSCVPATIEDGKAIVGNGGRVFTVSVSGSDYSFESGGKYLAVDDAESLFLTDTLDDYAKWNLEKKSGGYVMNNKAAKYTFSGGGSATVCIEYFSGSFSGWTYKSADSAIFEMNFYPVADGTNVTEGIVNDPQVVFGDVQNAYIGQDYSLSFTIDAVFDLEGEPLVMLGETALTPALENGIYTVTVPAEQVTGE